MTNKIIVLAVASIAVVGIFVVANSKDRSKQQNVSDKNITVYLSPTCGCCKNYLSYLRSNGFSVDAKETSKISDIKKENKVPSELESCHTSIINNYVVEGHIPFEVVNKLLAEKPNIRGIALAQMPSGSPGMPGKKNSPFSIHSITSDGLDGGIYLEY